MKLFRRFVLGWCLIILTVPLLAADLPTARPASVGMSQERLDRLREIGESYVDQGRIAGIITMVARHGKLVHFEVVGNRGADDQEPLTKDALFRIYSMSKPITAVAAMQLYEQGRFQLSDPVSKFLPELDELMVLNESGEMEPAGPITMQQLLTHTAGFSYGFNGEDPVDQLYRQQAALGAKDLDEFIARLSDLPLKYHPGSQWHYSVAVDVTGAIVERLSGQPFDEYLSEHIFEPLGMTDTFFSVPDSELGRFLPNHRWDGENNKLATLGEASISRFQNVTMFSGGGGLVSTAMDYMRFAEMLRNGGRLNGSRQILSPRTIEFMTMNHLPASINAGGSGEQPTVGGRSRPGFGFGLGFGLVTDVPASGVMGTVGEYSWGGAAGTIFWVDPVEDFVVVAMIQLMGSPWPLRSDLKVAVNQAIIGD